MSLSEIYTHSIGALACSAFGSTTEQAFFAVTPWAFNPVAELKFEALTGNAQLQATIDFAGEDPTIFGGISWVNMATFTNVSAASAMRYSFPATTVPMLPYGRMTVRAEATSSGPASFQQVMLKLFGE